MIQKDILRIKISLSIFLSKCRTFSLEPQRVQMETVFFYVFHFLGVRSKLRLALKRIFVAANAKKSYYAENNSNSVQNSIQGNTPTSTKLPVMLIVTYFDSFASESCLDSSRETQVCF